MLASERSWLNEAMSVIVPILHSGHHPLCRVDSAREGIRVVFGFGYILLGRSGLGAGTSDEVVIEWLTERIDNLGCSYEEKWLRLGYRVEWSEREPRAYEVRPVGCAPRDNDYLARLRTVREVDEWIRRAGPMAAGEEGEAGHGRGPESSRGVRDRGGGDDDPVSSGQ